MFSAIALLSTSAGFHAPSVSSMVSTHQRTTTPRMANVPLDTKIPDKFQWVPFANAADCKKGSITSGFKYGLEVAIVCDKRGNLYALSNKLPPFGQPATFAEIEGSDLIDPVTKNKFNLKNGKHLGTWCPTPLGQLIFNKITSKEDATTFACRKSGNTVEVKVNTAAKAQFEQKYWRGILDAQGKTDNGYY